MRRRKLLVTGAFAWRPEELAELERAGYDLTCLQEERGALPPDAAQAEAVVCNSLFLYHSLEKFPVLRAIQLTSAGLDRVDLPEIRRRGIALFQAEDAYAIPMAEWILLRVLELYKQARRLEENQRAHRWEKVRQLPELAGKRVLIVGTGHVGRAAARRFRAFEAVVTGVSLSGRPLPEFTQVYPAEHLDELLPLADILVLALPLNECTRGLLDARRLHMLPAGALVVNVSRGGLLDQSALMDALAQGHVFGAALDVFDQEPLPGDSPLWDMERVLLSSHNSFEGTGNHERLWRVICKNLIQGVERS